MSRSRAPETCSIGVTPVWVPWSSPMPLLRLDAAHAIAVCAAARLKKHLHNAASKSVGDATNCRSIDCGNGRLVPVCLGNERIFSQLLFRIFLAACHRYDLRIKKPPGEMPPEVCSTPSIQALDGGCRIIPATANATTIFA